MYVEGLYVEFYEDNGDTYTDDTENLSTVESLGAKVIRVEAK